MVTVTINVIPLCKYFVGVKIEVGYNFSNFLIPTKDFEYQPIHYGLPNEIDRFDSYLIDKNQYNDSVYDTVYQVNVIFDDIDVLTFEFETEEEALYFKLKYCSE